jgi:preprotein translocase subunit YajC
VIAPALKVFRETMFVTPAYAQVAGAAAHAPTAFETAFTYAPFAVVLVAFYFLLIRPQQQRAKALQEMLGSVKKGDSVVTAGGLIGKVTKVDDKIVEVEIATGVKVRVVKTTLAEVTPAGGAKPAND